MCKSAGCVWADMALYLLAWNFGVLSMCNFSVCLRLWYNPVVEWDQYENRFNHNFLIWQVVNSTPICSTEASKDKFLYHLVDLLEQCDAHRWFYLRRFLSDAMSFIGHISSAKIWNESFTLAQYVCHLTLYCHHDRESTSSWKQDGKCGQWSLHEKTTLTMVFKLAGAVISHLMFIFVDIRIIGFFDMGWRLFPTAIAQHCYAVKSVLVVLNES